MEVTCEVTYVTALEMSGFLNGVINLAFSTAQFVPVLDGEGKLVPSTSSKITANLRIDLMLAQILRDRLDDLISENTKPKVT